MIRTRRPLQTSSSALNSWKRNARICVVMLAVGFVCTPGVCQSRSETTESSGNSASKIELSSPAPRVFHREASAQEVRPDVLQLSLRQVIRMALQNSLDIRLEQIDQSVADFSVRRTQGGAIPRAINFNIAETPAGEAVAPFPLLDSTASTLSPNGVQPSGITVPPSYDAGHVLEAQHSLSIATAPFSAGAPVPAFDLDLLGQYGWIRRDQLEQAP